MSIKVLIVSFLLFFSFNLYSKNKIIFLGIDGLGGAYLNEDSAPNITKWLKKDGAYSKEMQNVLPAWSATNWYSMFSSSTTNQHHIKGNFYKRRPDSPPTYFDVLFKKNPKLKVVSLFSWKKLNELLGGGGRHKKSFLENDELVFQETLKIIRSGKLPDFLFSYFGDVDENGHRHKWGSDENLDATREVDRKVGEIIGLLKKKNLYHKTYLAISSDHGGAKMVILRSLFEHGGDRYKVRSIPFILSGPKIKQGLIKEELRIFDIFTTFAKIQGISDLPTTWVGRSIDSAFKNYKIKENKKVLHLSYSNSFKLILSNKRGRNFKVLRPKTNNPNQKFYPFGDVITTRNHPKRRVVLAPLIKGITAHPIGFEKILNNRKSFFNPYNFTIFSPIPPFGYICPGEIIVPSITTTSPNKKKFICIRGEYLSAIPSKKIWDSLFLMQAKYAISFWSPSEGAKMMAPMGTFFSRRRKNERGLDKGYRLKEEKVQFFEE